MFVAEFAINKWNKQTKTSYHAVAGLTKPNWLLEMRQNVIAVFYLGRKYVSSLEYICIYQVFISCTDALTFGVLKTLEELPLIG